MQRAELKVLGGRQAGKKISIEKQFLVGREQDCHLRPNSDLVSRHHCVFTLDDYTLRIRDLGSTNGTEVNDQRLEGQQILESGDKVRIGNLEFEVLLSTATEATPVAGEEYQADEDSRILASEELNQPTSETMVDVRLPAIDDDRSEAPTEQFTDENTGDTGTIPTFDPNQQPQQPWPQQGYYPQYPPGYYPPQGMPYPPPGYPPYYPPQQQPMPPQQGAYPQPPPDAVETPVDEEIPKIRLPDPADTGAKTESVGSGGGASKAAGSDEPNPSNTAADLLNKMRNRR